jgi:hypothetical protein
VLDVDKAAWLDELDGVEWARAVVALITTSVLKRMSCIHVALEYMAYIRPTVRAGAFNETICQKPRGT